MGKRFLYRYYRRVALLKVWLYRRLTRPGLLALVVLGVSAVFGLDTNLTMVFQVFTFSLALVVLALCAALVRRPAKLEIRRDLPRFATVGEPLAYRFTVRNPSGRAAGDLSIYEDLSLRLPSAEEFLHLAEPGEGKRNLFDRYFAYYRWSWLKRQSETIQLDEHSAPAPVPGGEADCRVVFTPARRGRIDFSGFSLARREPLGLMRSVRSHHAPGTVMVLPKRYPVPPVSLAGHRKYQPGGVALALSVGDSEEFTSLRDYRPGDPLRKIHWKSWAKLGKPVVKEHQDEFFVRHALVLDTFQSKGSADLFEEAVSVAASFASSVLTQESLLDLMFVGPEAYCFTSGRGLSHADRMLEILASVAVCRDKRFDTLPPLVLNRAPLLSACIVVLLDWDEARQEFIRGLKASGVPLKVLVVSEGDAGAPGPGPMAGDPGNFHFLKTGEIAKGLAAR